MSSKQKLFCFTCSSVLRSYPFPSFYVVFLLNFLSFILSLLFFVFLCPCFHSFSFSLLLLFLLSQLFPFLHLVYLLLSLFSHSLVSSSSCSFLPVPNRFLAVSSFSSFVGLPSLALFPSLLLFLSFHCVSSFP